MWFSFSVVASTITQTGSRARGPGGTMCPIPAAIPFPQGAGKEAIETCGSLRLAIDRVHGFFQRFFSCFFQCFFSLEVIFPSRVSSGKNVFK